MVALTRAISFVKFNYLPLISMKCVDSYLSVYIFDSQTFQYDVNQITGTFYRPCSIQLSLVHCAESMKTFDVDIFCFQGV
jgi:hypothetical protein